MSCNINCCFERKVEKLMRVLWVTRSFLDYRIPVYKELKLKCRNNFKLVFNSDYIPKSVVEKAQIVLGDSCVGLGGEFTIGHKDTTIIGANAGLRIPFQPNLIKNIKLYNPDVIISDGFFQWTYAALWMRFFHKIPHVMCYERTMHTERNAQWYRVIYRKFVSNWIDAICCSGIQSAKYVKSLNYSKHVTLGHMVADISFFLNNNNNKNNLLNLHQDNKALKYLYVGRIVDAKGINELLETWSLFQKNKNVVLYIIGDGPQKNKFRLKVKQKDIKKVFFLGKVNYEDLPCYYQSSDIFLIPTLEDNWSLVVPEAMASGLPILCSIFNGCYPEYVKDTNGWIFNPLDTQNFLNQLDKSYFTSNLKEMGYNSIRILKNFNAEKAASNIFKTINLVCST